MNENLVIGMAERAAQLNDLLLAQEADFELDYVRVWKNNTELEGYTLKSPKHNCAPTIYFNENWFNQSDEDVVEYLKDMYRIHSLDFDASQLTNREYILANILPRMVSEDNEAELVNRGIAHIKFLDMFILFYVPVSDLVGNDEMASVQVTEMLLSTAKISLEEAYKASLENLENNVEIKTMEEVLFGEMGIESSEFSESQIPMWICSTKNRIQGAASMLCASVLSTLEERIGGRVAILPSSIHECIAVPYNLEDELQMYLSLVKEVNSTTVSSEERLTDSVYYVENQKLQLAV